ncbi:hypothetical protein SAMN05216241_105117 [Limimonas halophila]|uniref:Curlin associated repeat-containing protein n=1 Tax=Limimonas halophila TaxID=1082479 RepID=A0A1G7RG74_9PROT|nr:hypothetical protein [Limimonas halophila]SDG09644.1 hypothetical protein SAMN05216241_105117 [Limimonas halophila]
MKKTLLTAVSVAAIFAFGSASHASNEQNTDQNGNTNNSTVIQAGAGNVAGTASAPNIQDGNTNTFAIDQVGDDNGKWSVTSGNNAGANVGNLNQAIVDGTTDTLNGNGASTTSSFPGLGGAFNDVAEANTRVRQLGDNNYASVNSGNERDSRSGGNFANVLQDGNNNRVEGTGGGESIVNAFSQSGVYNALLAKQTGSGNTLKGDQVGNRNTFASVQLNGGNMLDGFQRGNDNILASYQSGGDTAVVTQTGSGNTHTNIQGVTVPQGN